jgi:hypothetical protein
VVNGSYITLRSIKCDPSKGYKVKPDKSRRDMPDSIIIQNVSNNISDTHSKANDNVCQYKPLNVYPG